METQDLYHCPEVMRPTGEPHSHPHPEVRGRPLPTLGRQQGLKGLFFVEFREGRASKSKRDSYVR